MEPASAQGFPSMAHSTAEEQKGKPQECMLVLLYSLLLWASLVLFGGESPPHEGLITS